ncbi:MAG TPA: UDP-2,4-diacetamido-2,4,6-trideoxy-beta-L-altropyranose hydrolase [Caulobacteraceae bacterium]|jgi:UDP-2,4-diacetamido-2,4,6-trideoxy-beta-L-altropyranose hydrolase
MAAPRILAFPDCGPRIGGGHVMRCLTLARSLSGKGCTVAFAANPAAQGVLEAFGPRDMTIYPLSDDLAEAAEHGADWAGAFKADWVLLDHYRLSPAQEVELKGDRRLAVLDDLADRPRPADLVINPGYGTLPGNYAGMVPDGARVLAGPQYALVRPEFAAHRDQALARRREGGHLKHVLIALGLTDVEGITAKVVRTLKPHLPGLVLDVVLGDQASSLPALREAAKIDCALRLHVDSHAMAELMSQADLAVGAGGGSVWERATLGLPSVTVTLADNQRPMAQAMERVGLTLAVDALAEDFEAKLVAAVKRLVDDAALRRWLFEAPCHACDGLGADRVAEAMLG